MTYAEALKRFRKEFNLSQQQAADTAQVLKQVYQRYEYGREPSLSVLSKLADKYNVSIDYLVGRTDNPVVNRGEFSPPPALPQTDIEAVKKEMLEEFNKRLAKRVQRAVALLYGPDLDKLLEMDKLFDKTGEDTPS